MVENILHRFGWILHLFDSLKMRGVFLPNLLQEHPNSLLPPPLLAHHSLFFTQQPGPGHVPPLLRTSKRLPSYLKIKTQNPSSGPKDPIWFRPSLFFQFYLLLSLIIQLLLHWPPRRPSLLSGFTHWVLPSVSNIIFPEILIVNPLTSFALLFKCYLLNQVFLKFKI